MSDLNKTFEEQPGTPASQLAKKLAKENSALKKAKKYEQEFYTSLGPKVLRVTAKPHGATTEYVGNKVKNKVMFESAIKKWKTEKVWVSEEDADEVIGAAVKKLAAQKEQESKK